MVTDERLAEIEARANAATPGPWPTPAEAGDPYDERIPVDHEGCKVWPWGSSDDMEFAYKARTDVPDLIAEVRRLREVGDHLQGALFAYRNLLRTISDLEPTLPESTRKLLFYED